MSDTATYTAPGTLTPVLSDLWDQERSWTLQAYLDHGGYEGLTPPRISKGFCQLRRQFSLLFFHTGDFQKCQTGTKKSSKSVE